VAGVEVGVGAAAAVESCPEADLATATATAKITIKITIRTGFRNNLGKGTAPPFAEQLLVW